MNCTVLLQDDLRKDCRLMEFNALVNKFLSKDPEARKRDLHIRTYVSPCPMRDLHIRTYVSGVP